MNGDHIDDQQTIDLIADVVVTLSVTLIGLAVFALAAAAVWCG